MLVVASWTTRNRHVSTSGAGRSSIPECTKSMAMPVRSEKPFRNQSSVAARPMSSSIGGCSSRESCRADCSAESVIARASSIARASASGTDRRARASCILTAVSAWPISSCSSRAIRRRSSSCARTRRADRRCSSAALSALAANWARSPRSSRLTCAETNAPTPRLSSRAAPPVARNLLRDRPYTSATRRCCCCRCDRLSDCTCATIRNTLSRRGLIRSPRRRRRSVARNAGGSVTRGRTDAQ